MWIIATTGLLVISIRISEAWRRRRRRHCIWIVAHEGVVPEPVLNFNTSESVHNTRIGTAVVHKTRHFIVEDLVPLNQVRVPKVLVMVHPCMIIMSLTMLLMPLTLLYMPRPCLFMTFLVGKLHLLKHLS